MKKKTISLILILFLVVGFLLTAGIYYLFIYSSIPDQSDISINMEEVKHLALSSDDPLPLDLRAMHVAIGTLPSWMILAGGSEKEYKLSCPSFEVVYSDRSIIIDVPPDEDTLAWFFTGGELLHFSLDDYHLLQERLKQADQILFTHEHLDHMEGVFASYYYEEIMEKLVLSRDQVDSPQVKNYPLANQWNEETIRVIDYDSYHLISPGVVLIKTPGHSPGHQLIYIHLQNGESFLLVGDMVWVEDQLKNLISRPLFISYLIQEDVDRCNQQLRWLYDAVYQNPPENLHLVISHDMENIQNLMDQGLIGSIVE